ncbi:MAG: Crp/Fnr family transcriptional regulator [Cyanophyceae cyanobacterium]
METKAFSELFPLFSSANPEILDWLLSIAEEQDYSPDEKVLEAETWGRAVYFIVSGWIKIQRTYKEQAIAVEILGRGHSFGEMAILDEPLRSTEAIALTEVTLLSISAQRYLQLLFKEPQLQHRSHQLTMRQLRSWQNRYLLKYQTSGERLAKTLVLLAENYGQVTEKGTEIFNLSRQDLAQVAELEEEEVQRIMEKLRSKGWVEINASDQILRLTNPKQLTHLAGHI